MQSPPPPVVQAPLPEPTPSPAAVSMSDAVPEVQDIVAETQEELKKELAKKPLPGPILAEVRKTTAEFKKRIGQLAQTHKRCEKLKAGSTPVRCLELNRIVFR